MRPSARALYRAPAPLPQVSPGLSSAAWLPRTCSWSPCPGLLRAHPGLVHLDAPFLSFSYFFDCVTCGILVPQSRIKPAPPALEAWSVNHWTATEGPTCSFPRLTSKPNMQALPRHQHRRGCGDPLTLSCLFGAHFLPPRLCFPGVVFLNSALIFFFFFLIEAKFTQCQVDHLKVKSCLRGIQRIPSVEQPSPHLIPEHVHHPKRKSHTPQLSLPILLPQPLAITGVSLWISLFWTFPTNAIISYVTSDV